MRILAVLILLGCSCHSVALEWSDIKVVGLFGNAAAIEIQGDRRVLRVGQGSEEGLALIAVSGQTVVLMLDNQQREIALARVLGGGYQKPETAIERISINTRGQYLTAGSINGQSVTMLVDTGATSVAMNTVQARALGIDFASGRVGSSRTAGGIVKSYSVTLGSVKLGSIEVKQVRAAVLEGIYPTNVLLGMTFLKHVELKENEGIMTLMKKY